jgi:hypothetical protein
MRACRCIRLQGLNIVLRLAWLQSMTHLTFGSLDGSVMDFIFAVLEILCRGYWNFYRFFRIIYPSSICFNSIIFINKTVSLLVQLHLYS